MSRSAARITKPRAVPPLRDGDRMDADEFLQRYAADAAVHTAELLGGTVYIVRRKELRDGQEVVVPPISAEGHSTPDNLIQTWTGNYVTDTPGVAAHGSATTILPSNATGLEPDGVLRVLPDAGGRSTIGADKFIHGVPELVIEVSHSSGDRDLGPKYAAFEADGVPEYLVWRTDTDEILWFVLKRKKYVPLSPHPDGTLRSMTLPGLWLDPAALIAGDRSKVRDVLMRGIASPEHAAFVAKLKRAAGKRKKK
jgi:Uma2 family endonuclease